MTEVIYWKIFRKHLSECFLLHFARTDNPYLMIRIILHFLFFLILLFVSELSELILKLELVNGILWNDVRSILVI